MTVPKLRPSAYPSRCGRSLASQYSTPPSVCWACPSKVLVNAWTSSDFMCSPFGCAARSWRRTPLALSRRGRPAVGYLQAQVVVLHVRAHARVRLGHAAELGFPVAVENDPVDMAVRAI